MQLNEGCVLVLRREDRVLSAAPHGPETEYVLIERERAREIGDLQANTPQMSLGRQPEATGSNTVTTGCCGLSGGGVSEQILRARTQAAPPSTFS